MNEALKRALSTSRSLPTIPGVAVRILDLVRDDCALGDLVPALSSDPALAAKLIRYANSPAYRRAEQVATIRQAVVQLGLDATVLVALSLSLVDVLRPASAGALNYQWLWRRALVSAAAGRLLARALGVSRPEEVFLAALLQDVGMMAMDRADLGIYLDLGERQRDHVTLTALERGRARADHAAAGAWLLRSWGFPPLIVRAVARSHDLAVLDRAHGPTLDWCVACSGVLADAILHNDAQGLTEVLAHAEWGGSPAERWQQVVVEQLGGAVAELESLFDTALAPNLLELMNASKELVAERCLAAGASAPVASDQASQRL